MSTLLSTQNLSFHNNHGILLSNNADLARKSAHQKPMLQAQWQAEIEILKQQLDLA